jgi:cell pole-organizing protein PopZ
MAEQSAHEPTMEEILASIRRIISEDDAPEDAKAEPEVEVEEEPEAAAPEPEPEVEDEPEDDVLELTETYEAPATVSIGDIDAYEAPAPVAAAAPAPKPAPRPAAPSAVGGLVSERTESIAASSFGSLTSNLLVPHSDRTLEDVVKELLRPQLQAWLDENLPGIVEEQVRLEVERIARQSRR